MARWVSVPSAPTSTFHGSLLTSTTITRSVGWIVEVIAFTNSFFIFLPRTSSGSFFFSPRLPLLWAGKIFYTSSTYTIDGALNRATLKTTWIVFAIPLVAMKLLGEMLKKLAPASLQAAKLASVLPVEWNPYNSVHLTDGARSWMTCEPNGKTICYVNARRMCPNVGSYIGGLSNAHN